MEHSGGMNNDPNLISIEDKITELEKAKWSCNWEELSIIQNKIVHYTNKLKQGILYEPAF